MDPPAVKSPRRELQGPRPAPLKVRKVSHKIKKPPMAPPPPRQQPPNHHHRPPVIIYTVSPKVIHIQPSEFMPLVQRLTGSSSIDSSSSSSHPSSTAGLSPAARFAYIEKAKSPEKKKPERRDITTVGGVEMMSTEALGSPSLFPGILSPGPASLPRIPPSFFSPPSDPSPLSFLHDWSPLLQGNNKNHVEGSFLPSPSFLPPRTLSPNPHSDLFNNVFDS
ncbi:hypothetical protein NMG60_11032901 [Bertholletia excelsa]